MSSNLLTDSDFDHNVWVRFVSYMDTDVVMGLTAPRVQTYNGYVTNPGVGVRRWSTMKNQREAMWVICSDADAFGSPPDDGRPRFTIRSANDMNLCLIEREGYLYVDNDWGSGEDVDICTFSIDWVKGGTWFALNNKDHSRVFDISGSNTADGNDIILFSWNDGDNQVWRAERV